MFNKLKFMKQFHANFFNFLNCYISLGKPCERYTIDFIRKKGNYFLFLGISFSKVFVDKVESMCEN